MKIDVTGTPVEVPARWTKYTTEQKTAVIRMVQGLQERCGASLLGVHVIRVTRGMATHHQPRWRVHYGYSVGPS